MREAGVKSHASSRRSWSRLFASVLFAAIAVLMAMGGYLLKERQIRDQQEALNNIDIPFLQSMRVHHDQAITLAASLLESRHPTIRQLAHEVYNTQLQETGVMRGLLISWNAPQTPTGPLWEWMVRDADEQTIEFVSRCRSGGKMPGMLDQDEFNALFTAKGEVRDKLFVLHMMAHHQAAIAMTRHAAQHANSSAVRTLAATMLTAQRKELLVLGKL